MDLWKLFDQAYVLAALEGISVGQALREIVDSYRGKIVIKPTVGRIVWFYPAVVDQIARNGKEPLAAIVTCVWSDTCVNLAVFDANGRPAEGGCTSVPLVQDGMPVPDDYYCTWMPYQVGQAQKTEALQKQLDAKN